MKLHFLGTGAGGVIDCYNTCFVIENNNEYFLVDGGGGNQILKQLRNVNIKLNDIHNVFITHNHTDHILGLVWVIRSVVTLLRFGKSHGGEYIGNLNIYGSDESIKVLQHLVDLLFPPARQFFENRIIFNIVKDRQQEKIIGLDITFFDTLAKKVKQFGFKINNKVLFCGDEPLQEELFDFALNSDWLLHESFCLSSDEKKFTPHEKGHSTVLDASIIANKIHAKNLVLFHTVDNDLENRKKQYINEAKQNFNENVYVPNDFEIIEIK